VPPALAASATGNKPATYWERLVTPACDNAIPAAVGAVRGIAPSPMLAGSVPHGFCQSESTTIVAYSSISRALHGSKRSSDTPSTVPWLLLKDCPRSDRSADPKPFGSVPRFLDHQTAPASNIGFASAQSGSRSRAKASKSMGHRSRAKNGGPLSRHADRCCDSPSRRTPIAAAIPLNACRRAAGNGPCSGS
jgi:hypothetical protein